MNLVTIEDKLADIEIAIREFGLALKHCINDFRNASRFEVKYCNSLQESPAIWWGFLFSIFSQTLLYISK